MFKIPYHQGEQASPLVEINIVTELNIQPDFKMTMELLDHSVDYERHGIKIHIFWLMENMPRCSGAGDAILVRNVKVGPL